MFLVAHLLSLGNLMPGSFLLRTCLESQTREKGMG